MFPFLLLTFIHKILTSGGGGGSTTIEIPECHVVGENCCEVYFSDDSFESKACCNNCASDKSGNTCCGKAGSGGPTRKQKCKPFPVPKSCCFECFDATAQGRHIVKCPSFREECFKACIKLHSEQKTIHVPSRHDRFICKLCKFIECTYKIPCSERTRFAIELIYKELHHDLNNLLIFIAHALFNTDGFRFLTNWCDSRNDIYKSRGLLMITDEKNYRKLDSFSKGWLRHPNRLGQLTKEAICVTLKFWKWLIRENCNTYCSTLIALNPMEVQHNAHHNAELMKRLYNRKKLYVELCIFFGQKPRLGKC